MRTAVDSTLCVACGLCAETCPGIYRLGEAYSEVIADPVPAGSEDCALTAEANCPVGAISHA